MCYWAAFSKEKEEEEMGASMAKKAELMLLYDSDGALKRLVEIMRTVINTGEQPR